MTGQKRWRSEERYDCEDLWVFEEGVYANLDNLGDPEYELVKFDENTGRISWSVPLENEVRTLVLENGLLYVGEESYDGSGGVSYCLDPTTGNSRWHVRFGEQINSIECNNSSVLLQTTDMESDNYEETIYAVNDSGQTLWSFTDDSVYRYDAGEERIAVSGSDQGYVLARDDGRCVMRFDTSNEWHAGGGALFVADGTTISAYPLDSDPTAFSAGGRFRGVRTHRCTEAQIRPRIRTPTCMREPVTRTTQGIPAHQAVRSSAPAVEVHSPSTVTSSSVRPAGGNCSRRSRRR